MTRFFLTAAGLVYLSVTVALAIMQTPLGAPVYFVLAGIATLVYLIVLRRVWNLSSLQHGAFMSALAFALFFRVPLALSPVSADNDMIRYLWDGRVQRLGINPYLVLPADPELAWTHTPETRRMPSARQKTPYPPAAQLFFRLVVTVRDSPIAMKLALVACDLLTILVVWRWLAAIGRNQWLTLAYAWNPLVVLEIAYSGHIDALGALWISAAALWIARRRTTLAMIAFVLAVATKVLPIVLVPLLWRRVTKRDAALGVILMILLYLPFSGGPQIALGGLTRVVEHIRFNGPLFYAIKTLSNPPIAGATAVMLGLLLAIWCRWRLGETHPASWAWPMSAALLCAPVIYPWYLMYLTPFLVSVSTIPILVWTLSVMPVYYVWEISRNGGRWFVPPAILVLEFGAVILSGIVVLVTLRTRRTEELPT